MKENPQVSNKHKLDTQLNLYKDICLTISYLSAALNCIINAYTL